MATLEDLKIVLDSIDTNVSRQSGFLESILRSQERSENLSRVDRSVVNDVRPERSSPSGQSRDRRGMAPGGPGSGGLFGVGGGLAAIGAGASRAALGVGALGLAMPAFFGGLMAGDAGLGWLSQFGSGFDFDNLRDAAVGFTDIITDIDQESFVVLAGIMGISAVGGTRAARGLGSMGFAISAFLGGLLAGDLVFSGVESLGGNLNFTGMRSALVGFSDMIMSINPESLSVIGAILGGSAIAGLVGRNPLNIATAMGAVGAGVTALLSGLLAGSAVFSGIEALGGNLDYNGLRGALAGFSSSIGALTPEAAGALAAIIGAGGVAAVFGRGTGLLSATRIATTMSGIGAGIAGLMAGLTAGSAGIDWINRATGASGQGLVSAFRMFNEAIGELNNEAAITALGAIVAAGTGIGALSGAAGGVTALFAAGGIGLVMSGIGAGIAGLMIGLTAGSAGVEFINNLTGATGDGMVSVFRMFNDSILAITPAAIEKMRDLASIGGLDLAGAMGGLAGGMVALFGAGGLAQLGEGLRQGALDAIDWLFGTDYGENNTSAIQFLVDSLEPLRDLDMSLITKMDDFGAAINRFADSFASLGNINTESSARSLTRMIADMGGVLELFPYLMDGGTAYTSESTGLSRLFGTDRGRIDFGPEGGGLRNLANADLEAIANGVNALRRALGGDVSSIRGVIDERTVEGISTVREAGANGGVQAPAPNVTVAPVNVAPVTNNVTGGSSSAVITTPNSGGRSDLDYFAIPNGVG